MGILNDVGNAVGGGVVGGAAGAGPAGGIYGAYQGSKSGGGWIDNANPYVKGPRDAAKAKKESQANTQALYDKTGAINQGLNQADTDYGSSFKKYSDDYLGQAQGLVNTYTKDIGNLKKQAQDQATSAKATYTNDILPSYKDAMGKAQTNASQAMSLQQAGDPNNPVMKAVRDLYNKQGQGVREQGQQDFGVLSALGAQAAGQQFGASGPMTAGMQGQIYAANQAQAGDAYANAQKRMYDLQQQGIDRGFDQSNQMYQFGQQAQDRYSNSIKDYQGGQDAYQNSMGKYRGEIGGYAGDIFGTNAAMNSDKFNIGQMGADVNRSNTYASSGRQQNALNQYYGANQQSINNQAQTNSANNTSKAQFISSLLGSGAKILGSGVT